MQEYTYEQKMLGTDVVLSLITTNKLLADRIAHETFTCVSNYEKRFSRFDPYSELSQLNGQKQRTVSPEFLAVLKRSRELYQETDGIFNPLVQVTKLGYTKSFTALGNTIQPVDTTPYNTDFNTVTIDEDTRYVQLKPDQKLDFGGILKGYLAEKLSRKITDSYPGVTGNIVNLGGDLYSHGTDENNETFIFLVDNPITGEEIPLALRNTALTTSGTYKRHWSTPIGSKNHIVAKDGLTNAETDFISASVISQDGSLAEALTKVLLLYGPEALATKKFTYDYTYLLINKKGDLTTNVT